MTIDEIKEFIQVVIESGVAELEVQRGEDRVRIRRNSAGPVTQEIVLSNAAPSPAPYAAPSANTAPVPQLSATPQPTPSEPVHDPKIATVKSPIVGTYYDAPSPGAAPFIRVGDTVRAGQVLCIIESMKLMNEIEAEVSGVIAGKLVENGSPIEYGEALFTIRQP